MPSTVPVLAALIAKWPCWSWTCCLPPSEQPLALMHCCGSGWTRILVWLPSLIFLTVVGVDTYKYIFILKLLATPTLFRAEHSIYLHGFTLWIPNAKKIFFSKANHGCMQMWKQVRFFFLFVCALWPLSVLAFTLPICRGSSQNTAPGRCWINDARNSGRSYKPTTVDAAWTDCHM